MHSEAGLCCGSLKEVPLSDFRGVYYHQPSLSTRLETGAVVATPSLKLGNRSVPRWVPIFQHVLVGNAHCRFHRRGILVAI